MVSPYRSAGSVRISPDEHPELKRISFDDFEHTCFSSEVTPVATCASSGDQAELECFRVVRQKDVSVTGEQRDVIGVSDKPR